MSIEKCIHSKNNPRICKIREFWARINKYTYSYQETMDSTRGALHATVAGSCLKDSTTLLLNMITARFLI